MKRRESKLVVVGGPFEALRPLRDALPKGSPPAPARPVPLRAATPAPAGIDEATLLRREMAGVVPLAHDKARVAAHGLPPPARIFADDDLVRAHLRDLVEGDAPFDVADTVEHIEGSVVGLDRRVVKRLRRGEYAVQGHLDLHGLTRDEAHEAIGRFVREAQRRSWRCVVVVHGRGRGSKDQIPVLKESVTAWLTRGWLSRQVLAFSSARPHDGGAGAVYVLLRG